MQHSGAPSVCDAGARPQYETADNHVNGRVTTETGRRREGSPARAPPQPGIAHRRIATCLNEARCQLPIEEHNPTMIRSLIAIVAVFLIATFPATWLLMLFLGNLGLELSYWGTLPLGILVSTLLSGVSAPTFVVR